jgi:hypothetical protein
MFNSIYFGSCVSLYIYNFFQYKSFRKVQVIKVSFVLLKQTLHTETYVKMTIIAFYWVIVQKKYYPNILYLEKLNKI